MKRDTRKGLPKIPKSPDGAGQALAGEQHSCEGCGVCLGNREQAYITLDDVWLCRRCYEATPPAPGWRLRECLACGRGTTNPRWCQKCLREHYKANGK